MWYPFVIFDVDGTLVDTREATVHAAQIAYANLTGGENVPDGMWPDVFALSAKDAAVEMGVDPEAYERQEIEAYKSVADMEVRLFPGIMDALEQLHAAGCKFGVCTARIHEEMAFDFERLGLDRFDWVTACADETEKAKPDPEVIQRLLTGAGIKDPARALYLGDLPVDEQCAHAGGVQFAQAAWNGEKPLKGADYVLHAPEDLVTLVLAD